MIPGISVEDLFKQDSSHLVHGVADRKFSGLKIQMPGSLPVLKEVAH